MLRFLLIFLASLTVSVACDPFNPDLGEAPFRCAEDEPRCPDDYICIEHSVDQKFCELDPDN